MASGKESAGLLVFRQRGHELEVLLGHPGGPFWSDRDDGAWSIPKGGLHPGEDPLDAAIREFTEETGFSVRGPFVPLGSVTLKSGKRVHAWAVEADCDPAQLVSNLCMVEWPPRSGKRIEIPELDRVQYFSLEEARRAMNSGQVLLLDRLREVREEKD